MREFTKLLIFNGVILGLLPRGTAQSLPITEERMEESGSADPFTDLPSTELFTLDPEMVQTFDAGGGESTQDVLSVEPIADSVAGMSLADAEQVTEGTESRLPFMPRWLKLRMGAGVYHDDNLFLQPVNKVADYTYQYVFGASLRSPESERGLLSLDYNLTGNEPADHPQQSSQDQTAALAGSLRLSRATFSLSGNYTHSNGIQQQVGEFINSNRWGLNAGMTYELGQRTQGTLGMSYSSQAYQGLLNSQDASATFGMNYLLGTRTRIGVSGGFGTLVTKRDDVPSSLATSGDGNVLNPNAQLSFAASQRQANQLANEAQGAAAQSRALANQVKIQAQQALGLASAPGATLAQKAAASSLQAQFIALDGQARDLEAKSKSVSSASQQQARRSTQTPDQSYMRGTLTLGYEATGKLNLNASVGADFRRYSGVDAVPSSTSFTFSLSANYRLRERTTLALTASKPIVGAVALEGVSVDQMILGMSLSQKVGDRLSVSLNANYQLNDYVAIRTDVVTKRSDKTLNLRAEATYDLGKHAYVSTFYEFRKQDTTEKSLTFENNRIGVQVGVNF